MKVFLSWSGELSHKVALIFRDWLPSVLQFVEPYVSSEDIDKGARWSTDIAKELEEASFGILFITKDNIDASWLNFEAGALSKSIDRSRVCPFLFGIKRADVKGPLLQFQSTIFDYDDLKKLITTINSVYEEHPLDEQRLEKVFDVWWPTLSDQLESLEKKVIENHLVNSDQDHEAEPKSLEYLEEILELVRAQHRLINDPTELLPPRYLAGILRDAHGISPDHAAFRDLRDGFEELSSLLSTFRDSDQESVPVSVIEEYVYRLGKPIRYLTRKTVKRPSLFKKGILNKLDEDI